MKKIALILLLFTSLGYSQSLVKTYYDPLYKTKLKEVYQVKNNTPFVNGYYKLYDEYGNLLENKNYLNNKLNGKSTKYIGAYEATIIYGGKKNLGKVSVVSNYKNNILNGIQLRYNFKENGDRYLQFKKTYSNDILIKHVEYFSNNKEKKNFQIGKCFEYFESGNKYAEYIADENGQIQGKYTGWNEKGKIVIIGNFLNDEKNGEWVEFNDDGTVKKREVYKFGNKIPSEKEIIEKEKKVKKEQDFFENERKRLYSKKSKKISELNNDFKFANLAVNYDYEYSLEKRSLFIKYNKLIEFLNKDSENKEKLEKIKYVKLKIRLAEKMKFLFNKETKLLEEKLSNTENINVLINLILKE